MAQNMTLLDEMRVARASASHLRVLVSTNTLTEADGLRLLKRITDFFDHTMGTLEAERRAGLAPPDALTRSGARPLLTVYDGGRL